MFFAKYGEIFLKSPTPNNCLSVKSVLNNSILQTNTNALHITQRMSQSLFGPFPSKRGSMSVEAALVVPILLFVLYAMLMLSQLFMVHEEIAYGVSQTARYLAKHETEQELINHGVAKVKFHSYVHKNRLWMVDGGEAGIVFLKSKLPNEQKQMEVVASYRCTITVPLIARFHFPMEARSVQKAFVGRIGADGAGGDGGNVYVTESGSVYHTNPACSHLHITMVPNAEVSNLKGVRECAHCKNYQASGNYVTVYGDRFHKNPNCGGLKRTVHVESKDKVNLPLCSDCAGGVK